VRRSTSPRSRRPERPTRKQSRSLRRQPRSLPSNSHRPLAVAITGGIGAGKSEALAAFRRHGAATVSSDEIVHELLTHDDVKQAIVERLGNGVVGPDGALDRGAIGTVVFNDREALAALEALLHPLVSAEYLQWREQLGNLPDPPRVCVTEVPLLYEAGSEAQFDKVVVVTAPRKLRQARSLAAVDEREQRLKDDREKIALADYAYVNTGTLEQLDAWVASVMADLVA
jgi:dephospho-CoA kinase